MNSTSTDPIAVSAITNIENNLNEKNKSNSTNADLEFEEFCKKYFSNTDVKFFKKSTRRLTSNPSKPPHVKDIFNLNKDATITSNTIELSSPSIPSNNNLENSNNKINNVDYDFNKYNQIYNKNHSLNLNQTDSKTIEINNFNQLKIDYNNNEKPSNNSSNDVKFNYWDYFYQPTDNLKNDKKIDTQHHSQHNQIHNETKFKIEDYILPNNKENNLQGNNNNASSSNNNLLNNSLSSKNNENNFYNDNQHLYHNQQNNHEHKNHNEYNKHHEHHNLNDHLGHKQHNQHNTYNDSFYHNNQIYYNQNQNQNHNDNNYNYSHHNFINNDQNNNHHYNHNHNHNHNHNPNHEINLNNNKNSHIEEKYEKNINKEKALVDEQLNKPLENNNEKINITLTEPIQSFKVYNFKAEFRNKKPNIDIKEIPSPTKSTIPNTVQTNNNLKKNGLKVVACGMHKNGRLPIPKSNFFIDKGNFGDDAGFWSETDGYSAIGLADGATGNIMLGYDPGDFPRYLMKLCSNLFVENYTLTDARDLLMKAFDIIQDITCYGSCTACVITYDKESSKLNIANIGDSGYRLVRNGKIIHKSEPQRISYDCPRQLDSYPWKMESRKLGVSYTEIMSKDAFCETIQSQKDDVIILSSDGLYDNIDDDEIETIFNKSKSIVDASEKLVTQAIKHYRKPDDILLVIAKVTENRPSSIHSIYSKEYK